MKRFLEGIKYFPSGVLLLFISYVIVYFVDGKETYLIELEKLTSVNVLIYEIIVSGVALSVVGMIISALKDFEARRDGVLRWKDLIKIVLIVVFVTAICIIDTLVEKVYPRAHYFDGEVGTVFAGLVCILLIATSIIYIFYKSIECKKMNIALNQKKNEFK